MKKILALFFIITTSVKCFADTTVFQCKTSNNKEILVTMNLKKVSYSFGRNVRSPELMFSIPRGQASTYQWDGSVTSMYYNVHIPNGNFVYTVFSALGRGVDEGQSESGVFVTKNGKEIARIECDENKQPYINNLEGVNLPAEKSSE